MIDRGRFELIRSAYGCYASWAVWEEADGKPKSKMADLSVLDPDQNPALLKTLRPEVIMVGLNIARPVEKPPFRNFHDPNRSANDFKIRYAFQNTDFWGAYMTDIIKRVETKAESELLRYLRAHPEVVQANVNIFARELSDLNAVEPIILAFGKEAHRLIASSVLRDQYRLLVRLTHYSYRMSKEKYRETVLGQIAAAMGGDGIDPKGGADRSQSSLLTQNWSRVRTSNPDV